MVRRRDKKQFVLKKWLGPYVPSQSRPLNERDADLALHERFQHVFCIVADGPNA